MTSETMVQGRRNTVLTAAIGTVLASFAGSASALDWELDNGTRINWNTTLSVGTSYRATERRDLSCFDDVISQTDFNGLLRGVVRRGLERRY